MPAFLSADTLKLIGAAIFIALFFAWGLHEREMGKTIAEQAAQRVAMAQVIHDTEVNARAHEIAQRQVQKYKAVLAARPSRHAPHVWVCNNHDGTAPVPAVPGTGSGDHAPPTQPAVVSRLDIGPPIDHRLAVVDAEITALQAYIRGCQKAGRCAVARP